jgi:hypothetical protein
VIPEAQQLLASKRIHGCLLLTENHPNTPDSNLTKVALFVSILAHRFNQFWISDLAAFAVSTLVHHAEVMEATPRRLLRVTEVNGYTCFSIPIRRRVLLTTLFPVMTWELLVVARFSCRQISLAEKIASHLSAAGRIQSHGGTNVPYQVHSDRRREAVLTIDGGNEKYVPLLQQWTYR